MQPLSWEDEISKVALTSFSSWDEEEQQQYAPEPEPEPEPGSVDVAVECPAGAAAGDTILVEVGGTQVEVEIPDAVEQGQVFTVRVALDAEPGAVEPEAEESGFPWNSEDMQMRLASEEESSDSDGDFASEFKTRERSAPADQQETQHTLQQSMFGDAKKRSRKEDSIEKAQKKDSFARARSRK